MEIDLIIYLAQDWKSYRQSSMGYFTRAPFIKALSHRLDLRILCVNRPITPILTLLRKPGKILEWLKTKKRLFRIENNLFLFTPFSLVHDMAAIYFPWVEKMNRWFLSWQMKRVLNKLKFDSRRRCSLIFHPFQYNYLNLVNERLKIYEVYDAYSSNIHYPTNLNKKISEYENKVLKKIDMVFAVSDTLFQEKSKFHNEVHFTPHGVEFDLFTQALNNELIIPEDLRSVPKPRIGFTGTISMLLDFKLLNYLAETNPRWSFVLIGHMLGRRKLFSNRKFRSLLSLQNVYYLGRKDYELLPCYFKYLDVTLLPYNTELEFVRNVNSVKTYQYLASGKPVVSTDTPWVRPFNRVIKIARDNNEFAEKIREAISETSSQHIQQRIDIARNSSWGKRAEEVAKLIEIKFDKLEKEFVQ